MLDISCNIINIHNNASHHVCCKLFEGVYIYFNTTSLAVTFISFSLLSSIYNFHLHTLCLSQLIYLSISPNSSVFYFTDFPAQVLGLSLPDELNTYSQPLESLSFPLCHFLSTHVHCSDDPPYLHYIVCPFYSSFSISIPQTVSFFNRTLVENVFAKLCFTSYTSIMVLFLKHCGDF